MTFSNALAALWPKSSYTSRAFPLYILLILSSYVFVNSTFAQSRQNGGAGVKVQQSMGLTIGERVPEDFWTQEHIFYNEGDTVRGTLEQFKEKLLVLDFWATWCGACRKNFSTLESLQKEYSTDLVFVLVNPAKYKDSYEKINECYNNVLSQTGGTTLASIIFDEQLVAQFPHYLIPHYVWISKNGFIKAFTGSGWTLREAIEFQISQEGL